MDALRVLYVPNEAHEFRQLGFRRPFADLVAAGLLGEVSVFSLQWRMRNGGDPETHRRDLIERVREFRPNVVLMQHLGSTGLTGKHFAAMRAAANFELIYHEADPYSRWLHPLPRGAAAAGRAADVVFTVGTGTFRQNFRRAGAKDVRWSPHVFEPERYKFSSIGSEAEREFDIVVVANRNRPRFRGHPNWRDRIKFVSLLQERFGERLAVYGNGWTGAGARGPVDFSHQDEAIQSAWVSANWDHYAAEPRYFSNRLPISLAAGSIHATTYHPGYDDIFSEATKDFLILESDIVRLVDSIGNFLDASSPLERMRASTRAQAYAFANCRQDDQLVRFLNYRNTRIDPDVAAASWDIKTKPLQEL